MSPGESCARRPSIRAVVFDFDGLIVDTETAEFRSWQQVFQEHGAQLPLAVWAPCIGTTAGTFDPCVYLEEVLGRAVDREAVRRRREALFRGLMAGEGLRPGVAAYLEAARALGLKVGLASSSSRDWVLGYLRRFGLTGCFDALRTREDVARVKPAPDLYLRVAADLGVRPEEAVALEDSPNGALAAKAAGLYCVAVPNPVTAQLPFGPVDLRLDSLAELPLADLIARLTGQR